jgi:hypothetical protein
MGAIAAAPHALSRIDIFWVAPDLSMHHNAWNGTNQITASPQLERSLLARIYKQAPVPLVGTLCLHGQHEFTL